MEQVSGREAAGIPRKHPQVSRNPQGQSFWSPVQRKEEGSLRPWPRMRLGGAAHSLPRYEGLEGSRGVILVWEGSSSSTGAGTTKCAGLLPELGGWRPGMLPDSRRCPRHLGLVPSLGKPLGRQRPLRTTQHPPLASDPRMVGSGITRLTSPGSKEAAFQDARGTGGLSASQGETSSLSVCVRTGTSVHPPEDGARKGEWAETILHLRGEHKPAKNEGMKDEPLQLFWAEGSVHQGAGPPSCWAWAHQPGLGLGVQGSPGALTADTCIRWKPKQTATWREIA